MIPLFGPGAASWEIVVFDVIAQVQVEEIPKTKVIICFLTFNELIVLCEGMGSCWVRTNRYKGNKEQIEKSIGSPVFVDDQVSTGNYNYVDDFIAIKPCIFGEEHRPKGVEKCEEDPEEDFV